MQGAESAALHSIKKAIKNIQSKKFLLQAGWCILSVSCLAFESRVLRPQAVMSRKDNWVVPDDNNTVSTDSPRTHKLTNNGIKNPVVS
jgi:hypothetical protein